MNCELKIVSFQKEIASHIDEDEEDAKGSVDAEGGEGRDHRGGTNEERQQISD